MVNNSETDHVLAFMAGACEEGDQGVQGGGKSRDRATSALNHIKKLSKR